MTPMGLDEPNPTHPLGGDGYAFLVWACGIYRPSVDLFGRDTSWTLGADSLSDPDSRDEHGWRRVSH